MFAVREILETDRCRVQRLIAEHWGSTKMVTKGCVHLVDELPGFIATDSATDSGDIVGLVTYAIADEECEIVSLDSLLENHGIGSRLLEAVICEAVKARCLRVWLITTNDNTHAMRFYQRRGFNMAGLYLNGVDKAREIKPEIPLRGFDDIPIKHEIEFEKALL